MVHVTMKNHSKASRLCARTGVAMATRQQGKDVSDEIHASDAFYVENTAKVKALSGFLVRVINRHIKPCRMLMFPCETVLRACSCDKG